MLVLLNIPSYAICFTPIPATHPVLLSMPWIQPYTFVAWEEGMRRLKLRDPLAG